MSYLLGFVKSFNAEELQRFRQLDLIGKEELVRDEYAYRPPANKAEETKMPVRLKLTQAHFDKINSVLLDKIIYRLYGNDYRKILNSILIKGLSDLMWHELKILQRRVLKLKNRDEEVIFYKAVYSTLIKTFHPNYNSRLTHEYGKKYLLALGDKKTIDDEAYVALYTHCSDMVAEFFAGNETKYASTAYKVLAKWEKRLRNVKHINVHAYYYFVLGNYYKYFTSDADSFIKANRDALAALKNASPDVIQNMYGKLLCEVGLGYMEKSDFSQALTYYRQAFALTEKQFVKTYFHAGNYFYSAVCNQQPLLAKKVFETQLAYRLQDGSSRSLVFDIQQMKLILSLHLQDTNTAFECLNIMRSYKRNEVTHFANISLRLCETLYYYVAGENKTAATVAQRNLKHLNLPENNSIQFDYHRQFVDCIIKLIKQKEGTLLFPEKLQGQINGLQKGVYQCYNLLL